MQFYELDDAESMYFARELEHLKAMAIEFKYAPMKGKQFCPVDGEADPADTMVTWREYDMVGSAKLVSSYADDFPAADIFGMEQHATIKSYGSSYRYNLQEIRAAAKTGKSLEQRRARAAREAIDRKVDKVIQTGDSTAGLLGMLNQTNVGSYTVPADGDTSSKLWSKKTPDLILRDMFGIQRKIVEDSKETEEPNLLLLPLTRHGYIAETRIGENLTITILQHFLNVSLYIKSVQSWLPLETAGALGVARMVAYRLDPDVLSVTLPVPFEQFAPQQKNLAFWVPCHARCGGVQVFRPMAMLYGDGI